jgi:hypothetical protein
MKWILKEDLTMCFKKIVIVLLLVAALIGCGKSEKKADDSAVQTPAPTVQKEAPQVATPKEYIAAKFSDGNIWENGINKRDGNQFFITIATNASTPVKTGDKVKFAASGEAVITNYSRMERPKFSAIFVVVNIKLDPVGDGYPHSIVFLNAK